MTIILLLFAYIVIPLLLRTALQLKMCNTRKQVNNQQQDLLFYHDHCRCRSCSCPWGAYIAANGFTERYVAIVQDLICTL